MGRHITWSTTGDWRWWRSRLRRVVWSRDLLHATPRGKPCSSRWTASRSCSGQLGGSPWPSPVLTSLEVRQGKLQGPLRAGCAIELYRATQLLGQEAYQLQAERSQCGGSPCPLGIRRRCRRTTRTICPSDVALRVMVISPPRSPGKAYFRLFESNSFTSKPQGTAFLTAIQIGSAWMLKVTRSPGGAYAWKTWVTEPVNIFGGRNARDVPGLTQTFVHERHRLDALLAILEERAHLGIRLPCQLASRGGWR